jgi:4-amino-4-deoxy-L-arabinose transferase-like glycosyltransferase
VALLYLLVARVFDRRTALAAAALAAVAPSLVFLGGGLLSENLFIPLVLGTAALAAWQRDRGGWQLAAAAGAVLGLAVLTRSNGLLLALPLMLGLRGWQPRVVALVAIGLTLVPWTVRNYGHFDRVLPLGTQSGYTVAGQWNGTASRPGPKRAEWLAPIFIWPFRDLLGQPGLDEGDVDAELRSRALEFAIEHPTAVIQAVAINIQRTFSIHPGHSSLDEIAFQEMGVPAERMDVVRIGGYVLALLALGGVVIIVRRRAGPVWLWLFPVVLFAGYVVWLGTPRYRVPVDAFLTIPAAIALTAAVSRARSRSPAPPAPGSS